MALAARSSDDALAELYDRFGGVAYGVALRVLRDRSLADDAVQEGFLAIWRSADRYMPERGRAAAWCLTLVHRRAVDLVRAHDRRRADALEDEVERGTGDSAEEAAWRGFERERVQTALRGLPDQQREALELAYYGGFTQSELAEKLGGASGYDQEQDVQRARPASRAPGGHRARRYEMEHRDVHELTAGYPLHALSDADARRSARGASARPARAILEQAKRERANVVPIQARRLPRFAAVARQWRWSR